MISLAIYLSLTVISLFFFGYGISALITPKPLAKFVFWFSPWYSIIFIIISLVTLNIFNISVFYASPFIVFFLSILTIYAILRVKVQIFNNIYFDLLVLLFVSVSIIINVSPLIRRDKMMTTVSLGNNDVVAYATTGDFLVKNTIFTTLDTPVANNDVDNLLYHGYRWGVPVINAFFLNLFNLKGYQFTYSLQVVLFALMIPLQYILFTILYKKDLKGLLLVLTVTAFNVNLLYILYHNFFGQVLFWGLEIFIFIFMFTYLASKKIEDKGINIYDHILSFSLATLFFSYHEPLIFIVLPLIVYLIFTIFIKYKVALNYFYSFVKISIITFIISSSSIFYAFILDYVQAFNISPDQPIGWALFRNKIPFANPFEAIGSWSIHNFGPLPIFIALPASLIIIFFIVFGLIKSRYKLLTASFLIIYAIFFYWTVVLQNNFFTYNRALTYNLPLLLVIFTIGIVSFFEKNKKIGLMVIFLLIGLEIFSGFKLNKRFRSERLSVDKSYISIQNLKKINIKEPVYTETFINDKVPLWKQIWIGYFLYFDNISPLPSELINDSYRNKVPDNSLLLLSKPTPWMKSPLVIFRNIIWSNEYYQLGHLCNNDECLIASDEKLSTIEISKNNYEDSLLLTGWEQTDGKSRWSNQKESTLRLVTKNIYPDNLEIQALSLNKPQEMTVYLDDRLLGNLSLGTEWTDYRLPVSYLLNPGVHKIKFIYSYGYRPMDVIPGNLDSRTLYVNFKKIALE